MVHMYCIESYLWWHYLPRTLFSDEGQPLTANVQRSLTVSQGLIIVFMGQHLQSRDSQSLKSTRFDSSRQPRLGFEHRWTVNTAQLSRHRNHSATAAPLFELEQCSKKYFGALFPGELLKVRLKLFRRVWRRARAIAPLKRHRLPLILFNKVLHVCV